MHSSVRMSGKPEIGCGNGRIGTSTGKLFPPAALLAEPHVLGKLGTRRGIVRRHHRIVRRQPPFFAILLRRHVVLRAQMTLERFEFLAVLQADDVIGRDRPFHRHRRLQRLGGRILAAGGYPQQRRMHLIDQGRDFARGHRIIADESGDDTGSEFDEVAVARVVGHGPIPQAVGGHDAVSRSRQDRPQSPGESEIYIVNVISALLSAQENPACDTCHSQY
jgi:hypothetical protein